MLSTFILLLEIEIDQIYCSHCKTYCMYIEANVLSRTGIHRIIAAMVIKVPDIQISSFSPTIIQTKGN